MSSLTFTAPFKQNHSIGTRCAAEFIATALGVGLGNGAMANAVLGYTKAHDMGYGWVALAAGLSYALVMVCFSSLRNFMNPAIGMGYAVAGDLPWGQYWALAGAQLAGGCAAGLITWLAYLPHYLAAPQVRQQSPGVEDLAGSSAVDHARLAKEAAGQLVGKGSRQGSGSSGEDSGKGSGEGGGAAAASPAGDEESAASQLPQPQAKTHSSHRHRHAAGHMLKPRGSTPLRGSARMGRMQPAMRLPPATRAAKILSTFATRPAIYCLPLNLLSEALATCVFVLVVLLLMKQGTFVDASAGELYMEVGFPLLYGITNTLLMLTLGGPTTFAGNPARDLGTRLAHWLLPIPGKGSSEWHYAWVPALGPLAGGAAAGALYKGVRLLLEAAAGGG